MPFPHPRGNERNPSYWIESSARTEYPPVTSDLAAEVLIVGAGIAGVTAAYLLAHAGKSVIVIDRGRVAMSAPWHAAAPVHCVGAPPDRTLPARRGPGAMTGASPRTAVVVDPDAGGFATPGGGTGVRPEGALVRNEAFGPLVSVMRFSTFDEAVELANGHGYGLSSAIYTSDPKTVWDFRARVSAGMLSVNNSTSGAEAHLPFGGNGRSGNGSRQSGIWVLDQFTRWQSMNWDYAGTLQKAQMDTEVAAGDPTFRL